MAGRKIRDHADARVALREAEASGLTRVDWAREAGVDARSLNMWRLNLARPAEPRDEAPALRLVELVQGPAPGPGPGGGGGGTSTGAEVHRALRGALCRGRRALRGRHAPSPAAGGGVVLSLPAGVRVFVGIEPVDMRGSFDAMAGAPRRLGLQPVDGNLYCFLNRRRQLCRVPWFDGSGWQLLSKRLERGTFELPDVAPGVDQVSVDPASLASLLAGIDLRAARRRWWRRAA